MASKTLMSLYQLLYHVSVLNKQSGQLFKYIFFPKNFNISFFYPIYLLLPNEINSSTQRLSFLPNLSSFQSDILTFSTHSFKTCFFLPNLDTFYPIDSKGVPSFSGSDFKDWVIKELVELSTMSTCLSMGKKLFFTQTLGKDTMITQTLGRKRLFLPMKRMHTNIWKKK